MARYIDNDYNQTKLLPINFADQILPGSFEHTICFLVDHKLELSRFDERYKNDDNGRPAYNPAILLKILLAAYSRGITSSRKIERLCQENIIFMALSADTQPHFTTIASFAADMTDVVQPLFVEVLMICQEAGLIGQEMFAIDGCKLPSNASKEWSGTHEDLTKKHKKIDRAVRRMLKKHREEDESGESKACRRTQEEKQIDTLRKASKKIKKHLSSTPEKIGISGNPVKGNVTDNESAKMKTSKGVIQGYNGVAAVDKTHQIIIAAEAFGQGPENNLLEPLVEQVKSNLSVSYLEKAKLTVDSGFHSKNSLEFCENERIDAYIADDGFRKRDPRFIDRDRYQPKERQRKYFIADEFIYDEATDSCRCPAGKSMWKSQELIIGEQRYASFVGYLKDCRACPLLKKCMRNPIKEVGRKVAKKIGQNDVIVPSRIEQMKEKIDSDDGRHIYSQRLGTVEPVFGNINTTKGLNRFSYRGKKKVNTQWLLYCLVHNIEKYQRYGQYG